MDRINQHATHVRRNIWTTKKVMGRGWQSKTNSIEEAERWKAPGEQCRPKDGLGGLAPRKNPTLCTSGMSQKYTRTIYLECGLINTKGCYSNVSSVVFPAWPCVSSVASEEKKNTTERHGSSTGRFIGLIWFDAWIRHVIMNQCCRIAKKKYKLWTNRIRNQAPYEYKKKVWFMDVHLQVFRMPNADLNRWYQHPIKIWVCHVWK